jgi:sugar phosphate isomerase/epimerase
MNVHPDRLAPMHDRSFCISKNLLSLRELEEDVERTGVGIMIENLPGSFNTPEQLGQILDPLPTIGLHLDIGHCNLKVDQITTGPILRQYGDRLKHVHLHDNRGGELDLHLPLGSGDIDIEEQIRILREIGYDGTITLEVFTPDPHYFHYSAQVLREIWSRAAVPLAR